MTYLDLEAEPLQRRDVYPADVVLPDGTELSRALVVLTTGAVYVWTSALDEPVLAALLDPVVGASVPGLSALSTATWTARTADGQEVSWTRGAGCRCGSLARFRPFSSPRRAP